MLLAHHHRKTDFPDAADDLRGNVWTTGHIAQEFAELFFPTVRREETRSYRHPRHRLVPRRLIQTASQPDAGMLRASAQFGVAIEPPEPFSPLRRR